MGVLLLERLSVLRPVIRLNKKSMKEVLWKWKWTKGRKSKVPKKNGTAGQIWNFNILIVANYLRTYFKCSKKALKHIPLAHVGLLGTSSQNFQNGQIIKRARRRYRTPSPKVLRLRREAANARQYFKFATIEYKKGKIFWHLFYSYLGPHFFIYFNWTLYVLFQLYYLPKWNISK